MKYPCLIYHEESAWPKMPKAEQDKWIAEVFAFNDAIQKRGHYIRSDALEPTHTATTVRVRMRDSRPLNHPDIFQLDGFSPQMLEQWDTLSKQDGCQVDINLVDKTSLEALLQDIRAKYVDILIPCDSLGLANGAFNAVGDERERRAWLDPFLWDGMGDDKIRSTPGRFATPRTRNIKGSPSRHGRPYCFGSFQKMLGAGTRDFELHIQPRKPEIGVAAIVPFEDLINLVVRPGDKTIKPIRPKAT